MSTVSHYVINVSKPRRPGDEFVIFFFRVEEERRSAAKEVYNELRKRFTPSGYLITVTYWSCLGQEMSGFGDIE